MDFLKRFLCFNILSIIGYGVLGYCIYNFIVILFHGIQNLPGMALVLGALIVYMNTVMFLIYFLSAFFCEFLILFILSKNLKKQVGLNFNNKIYDLLFRFGIFACFIPITIIISFAISMILVIIFKCNDSLILVIILCFCIFNLEIKDIFFKKYFRIKTK